MANRDAQIKRYIRSIRMEIPCAYEMKKSIMQRIQESVELYLEQNPTADIEEVRAHFGTPQAIALSYIEDQDGLELLKKMHLKRRILAMVAGVLAVVVLSWVGIAIWGAIHETQTAPKFITVKTGEK